MRFGSAVSGVSCDFRRYRRIIPRRNVTLIKFGVDVDLEFRGHEREVEAVLVYSRRHEFQTGVQASFALHIERGEGAALHEGV